MRGYTLVRLLTSIAAALVAAAIIYLTHPDWFRNRSIYSFPVVTVQTSPTAGATVVAPPTKPVPRPTVPGVNMTLHLDDIWITPDRVEHSQGASGIRPNLGDEFLIVSLFIKNRSQVDYQVHVRDFQVLDSQGVLEPPLSQDFTRRRLREVTLIPQGYIRGTLIFEVPLHSTPERLIYQPDVLTPTKQKIWVLP